MRYERKKIEWSKSVKDKAIRKGKKSKASYLA